MKVMFVDDEIMVLNGLKRAFFRSGWQIFIADSGAKALQILQKEEIDILVTDMRMPFMSGVELLEKVSELYPRTVRIILSGHSDEEAAKQASFVAHQWLSKPFDPVSMERILNHIACIRNSLPDPSVQDIVGQIKSLPSPPKMYMRLNLLLNDDTVDIKKIAKVIANDSSLVAKLLQLTNSSFFSNGKPVGSLTEAITRLGVDLVCSIVLAAETYSKLEEVPGYSLSDEQKHCLLTARLAASMVEPSLKQETILAGLLHNIGKFILYKVSPDAMELFIKQRIIGADNLELENKLFKADHTQLAGYLLHLWNFPYKLIESIVLHHRPEKLIEKKFGVGAAVYLASRLLRKLEIDESFVAHFNIEEKLDNWREKAAKYS